MLMEMASSCGALFLAMPGTARKGHMGHIETAIHEYAKIIHNIDEAILGCHRSEPGQQGRQ